MCENRVSVVYRRLIPKSAYMQFFGDFDIFTYLER